MSSEIMGCGLSGVDLSLDGNDFGRIRVGVKTIHPSQFTISNFVGGFLTILTFDSIAQGGKAWRHRIAFRV
jgi:hypothetical protein